MPVKGVQGRGAGSLSNHTGAVGAGADLNEAGDLAVPDYHPHSMVGDAFDAAHRCDSATDGIPEFSTPGKRGIGVLASGTGPPSKLAGIPAGRAVGLAACNYNPDLANEGADWRLETIKKDDRAHPQAALDTMQEYRSDGIAALAGPVSGGSASAILDHVSNNGMVAISHG